MSSTIFWKRHVLESWWNLSEIAAPTENAHFEQNFHLSCQSFLLGRLKMTEKIYHFMNGVQYFVSVTEIIVLISLRSLHNKTHFSKSSLKITFNVNSLRFKSACSIFTPEHFNSMVELCFQLRYPNMRHNPRPVATDYCFPPYLQYGRKIIHSKRSERLLFWTFNGQLSGQTAQILKLKFFINQSVAHLP